MSLFSEAKPQWNNVGVEPSGAKKIAGWLPNEKPPAEWFNWLFNRNYKCIDEIRTVVDSLNTNVYGATNTGNDTYVITPSPAIAGYSAGMVVNIIVDVGNTGAATANISGLGARDLKKFSASGKVALATGDMIAGGVYSFIDDGTHLVLINPNAINTSLFTAAGDIIRASGVNTPARLALGAALQMLRVNAGGTDLEYATPVQMASGTYLGDGNNSRDIAIGLAAKIAVIFTNNIYWIAIKSNVNKSLVINLGTPSYPSSDDYTYISTTNLKVDNRSISNSNGTTYYYVALA